MSSSLLIHKLKLALKCTLDGISKMMHFSCKSTFMAQNLYLSKIPRNTYCKSFYLWFIKKKHDSNVIIHRELYMYLHSGQYLLRRIKNQNARSGFVLLEFKRQEYHANSFFINKTISQEKNFLQKSFVWHKVIDLTYEYFTLNTKFRNGI